MGGLDPAKLLMILLVALVVLGPERLPRVARQLAGAWRELNRLRERFESEVREAMPDVQLPAIPKLPSRGITGYLTSMMSSTASGDAASAPSDGGGVGGTDGGGYPGGSNWSDGAGGSSGPAALPAGYPETAWVSGNGSSGGPGDGQMGGPAGVTVPEAVPAGWNTVGANAPGYASGSVLAAIPSFRPAGPMAAEKDLNLDDPSWN